MINFSLSFMNCFEVTDGGRRDRTGRRNKKVLKDPVETERVIWKFWFMRKGKQQQHWPQQQQQDFSPK